MPQNIYDDPAFFAGYSTLPRSVLGLAGAAEGPSLQTLLPDLAGLRIVDLGNLDRPLATVHVALIPRRVVCSVEHPLFTAPSAPGFRHRRCGTRRVAARSLPRREPAHDRPARAGRREAAPHRRQVRDVARTGRAQGDRASRAFRSNASIPGIPSIPSDRPPCMLLAATNA